MIVARTLAAEAEGVQILSNIELDWESEFRLAAFVGSFDSGAAELAVVLAGYHRHVLRLHLGGSFRASGGCLDKGIFVPSNARVGYVGPDPADQIVGLSVNAELAWARAVSRPEHNEEVPEMAGFLTALDCEGLEGRLTKTLSSGERQRVALASIAIGAPDLLVLDQCFSALDAEIFGALRSYIAARAASGSETWLVCMPQQKIWREAERVAHLEAGRLVWSGRGEGRGEPGQSGAVTATRSTLYRELAAGVARHCRGSPFGESLGLEIRRARLPSELGDRRRLDVEGVDVSGGQLLAVQGRNGSGKSSLLSALIGVERGREVDVDCRWRPVSSARRPRICYLPPDGVAVWIVERSPEEIWGDLLRDGAEKLAVDTLPEDRYRRLEGGNYRRRENPWRRLWWIATGILADLPWLLLDEPTTGMDDAQRQCLIELLNAHWTRGGSGLLVSHDADFLARCCQRRIVLHEGSVREQGLITLETASY